MVRLLFACVNCPPPPLSSNQNTERPTHSSDTRSRHPPTLLFLFTTTQAKARAAKSLTRLIDGNHLPGFREKGISGDANVWPPAPVAPVVKDQTAGVLDSSLLSSVEAGEARRVSRRDAPMVLLVREGAVVATLQDGTKTTVRAGVCVFGTRERCRNSETD